MSLNNVNCQRPVNGTTETFQKENEEPKTRGSERKRETWGKQREFILASIGYSVGLGNIWRFPYLCYKNGGGAFLIPYCLFVAVAGIPLFFLEVALGQYTQRSAIDVWEIIPSMKGIGFGSTITNSIFCIYNMIVMAWSVYYLIYSVLPGKLPWTSCNNTWNTPQCVEQITERCPNKTSCNVTLFIDSNASISSPDVEFWRYDVLRQSSGLHDMGSITNWPLVVSFFVSWIVIYLCVFKGTRSGGKVVYVTATVPYVLLFVLLVRGLTLEGSTEGLVYLLRPNFTKLAEPQVWMEAGGQILLSYGVCFTVLITFGSFNKFSNNCYRQSIGLAITCSMTSLFASLVVFSTLGHMAHVQSKHIGDVATSGPGLVFMVYSVGLSLLPVPKVWSCLFFITLLLIGIDSQFACVEGCITSIAEIFPQLTKRKHGREEMAALVCLALLLLGLPLLMNGGIYLFELLSMYGTSGMSLMFLVFFESLAIGWLYEVDRFRENVKSMIGYYPTIFFNYCYRFLTPGMVLFIFLFYCVKHTPITLDDYVYPPWANAVGWLMSLASMICVPLGFAWTIFKMKGTFSQRFAAALKSRAYDVGERKNSEVEEMVSSEKLYRGANTATTRA